MSSDPLIKITDVSVTYPGGQVALTNVSLDLRAGKIYGLVGVNGAGKSTLFKTIMGFITPGQGSIFIAGKSVKEALKNNLVAYVPQSEDVDWDFPVLVEDVVMMGRYGHMGFFRRAKKADHEAVNEAIERVGLTEFKTRQIGELSGGQKKRVFLARALAQQAKVILLDEPFTGVDVKTEDTIIDLMRDLSVSGHLMLVSTHNLGSVPDFCDDVILIKHHVVAAGPVETTFTHENLESAFGGMLRFLQMRGTDLHDDEDPRKLTVLTDDERPLVLYGQHKKQQIVQRSDKDKPEDHD